MGKETFKQIIAHIDSCLNESEKDYYSDFYVGITNDVHRRLFGEHNVQPFGQWWICRQAIDKKTAQLVEEFYLDKGMKGDTGGGTDDSTYVYCYEISENTVQ